MNSGQTLDGILDIIPPIKTSNLILSAVSSATYIVNEVAQILATTKQIAYHPAMGYISDIAMPAAYSALAHCIFENSNKKTKILGALALPTLLTAYEFFPFLEGGPNTFDPIDIVCYWASSIATQAYLHYDAQKKVCKQNALPMTDF